MAPPSYQHAATRPTDHCEDETEGLLDNDWRINVLRKRPAAVVIIALIVAVAVVKTTAASFLPLNSGSLPVEGSEFELQPDHCKTPDGPEDTCCQDGCGTSPDPDEVGSECGWGDALHWMAGDDENNQRPVSGKPPGCTYCQKGKCYYKTPLYEFCNQDYECMSNNCLPYECVRNGFRDCDLTGASECYP